MMRKNADNAIATFFAIDEDKSPLILVVLNCANKCTISFDIIKNNITQSILFRILLNC